MTELQLIDKWIAELQELGYDHEGMIRVFRLAHKKYNQMITEDAKDIECMYEEIYNSTKKHPMCRCTIEVIADEIEDAELWENEVPDIICPECGEEVMENVQTGELYCLGCDTATTKEHLSYKCPACGSENIDTDFATGGHCKDCNHRF